MGKIKMNNDAVLTDCPSCGQSFNKEKYGNKCPYCEAKDEDHYVKGWIVCVKGSRVGESNEIRSGENRVQIETGKNSDGDFLYVNYDSEKKRTFILPNFTRGLIKINDGDVLVGVMDITEYKNKLEIKMEKKSSSFIYVHLNFDYNV